MGVLVQDQILCGGEGGLIEKNEIGGETWGKKIIAMTQMGE